MLTYLLLVIGFVLLIKGADWLVDGAADFAQKMQISAIAIGLTIVSFGTSAPEFIINLLASARGSTGIAVGNIIGSNIINMLFILGLSAMVYPLTTHRNTVWKEIPLSLLAAILLAVMANDQLIEKKSFSEIGRIDGIILIAFFIIFIYYTFGIARASGTTREENSCRVISLPKSGLKIMAGLAGLFLGGKWIVDGAVAIARNFGLTEELIGLTIVAAGTSLPELATSVMAAFKKEADIAVGNIVGSNIFNIFWILGVSACIQPMPLAGSLNLDIAVTIVASAILFLAMFIGKKHTLERWQGMVMVSIYLGYFAIVIGRFF